MFNLLRSAFEGTGLDEVTLTPNPKTPNPKP